METLYKKDLR